MFAAGEGYPPRRHYRARRLLPVPHRLGLSSAVICGEPDPAERLSYGDSELRNARRLQNMALARSFVFRSHAHRDVGASLWAVISRLLVQPCELAGESQILNQSAP